MIFHGGAFVPCAEQAGNGNRRLINSFGVKMSKFSYTKKCLCKNENPRKFLEDQFGK